MDKRILCVDDEPTIRELLVKSVTSWGYDIQCASSFNEAIEMFEAMDPFLTITDLKLENSVDGVTLADRLHRRAPLGIFIALSGYISAFDMGYLLGSVFTDVLDKPVDLKVLKQVIDYAWEKRHRWEAIIDD